MDFDFFFFFSSIMAIEQVWSSDPVKWGEEETKEGRERVWHQKAEVVKFWKCERQEGS